MYVEDGIGTLTLGDDDRDVVEAELLCKIPENSFGVGVRVLSTILVGDSAEIKSVNGLLKRCQFLDTTLYSINTFLPQLKQT